MKRIFGGYFILLLLVAATSACDRSPPAQASETPPPVAAPAPELGAVQQSAPTDYPTCEGYYCEALDATTGIDVHALCAAHAPEGSPVRPPDTPVLVTAPETGEQCYCHCGSAAG